MASTSSSATSITSTPRKNRRTPTTPRTRISAKVRAARRTPMQGERPRRPHGRSGSGGRQADDREHRRARQQAHGNRRRGDFRRGDGFHQRQPRPKAVLLLVQLHADAYPHASDERSHRPAGLTADQFPTAWSRTTDVGSAQADRRSRLGDNTIVIYTTDNGPKGIWPDGGDNAVPRREGDQLGGRVPRACMIRWPGESSPAPSQRDISGLDGCRPAAAAGEPDMVDKLLEGTRLEARSSRSISTAKQLPYLNGRKEIIARKEFIYFSDDGDVVAIRYRKWKAVFEEQRAKAQGEFGQGSLPNCVCRKSTTCVRIPSNAPTAVDTTTTGRVARNPRAGRARVVGGSRDLQGVSAGPRRRVQSVSSSKRCRGR